MHSIHSMHEMCLLMFYADARGGVRRLPFCQPFVEARDAFGSRTRRFDSSVWLNLLHFPRFHEAFGLFAMEARAFPVHVALHGYTAKESNELNIHVNEKLLILNVSDSFLRLQ